MFQNVFRRVLPLLLGSLLLLTACGAPAAPPSSAQPTPPPSAASGGASGEESESSQTLAELYGEDYVTFVTETLTMQMENRMEKTPERVYFPVRDKAPLSDYITIDETTEFHLREDGNIVIVLPAGSVTDEVAGEQEFILPKP